MSSSRREAVETFGREVQRYQRASQTFDDEVARALRLGSAELRCLDWLTEKAMPSGALAKAIGLRPAATTALVDRLAGKGLVRRESSAEDRRKVLVTLTEEGQRLLWEVYGPVVRDGQRLLDGISVEQIEVMKQVLRRMTENAEEHSRRIVAEYGDSRGSSVARVK